MSHLTQARIDTCISDLNKVIGVHNRISPTYPLQVLAEGGDVWALSRDALAEDLKDQSEHLSIDKLVATYSTRTKRIYIVKEAFPEQVDYLREIAGDFLPPIARVSLKYSELTLLNIIFYENVHRSCLPTEEIGAIAAFFRDALRDYYKNSATEAMLETLSGAGARMKVQGFNFSMQLRDGKWYNAQEALDEFAATLLTAETLARALGQSGMVPEYQDWRKLFFLHRLSDEMVDPFSEALPHVADMASYDLLMQDYISSAAARHIYGRFGREGPSRDVIGAVLGLISGEAKAVPLFVEGLYGGEALAGEGAGGRGLGKIIRGIFRR